MAEFDFTQAIGEARAKYESIAKALDIDRLKAAIKDLETQAAAPGLWDDPENAQKITSRLSAAESQLKRLNSASSASTMWKRSLNSATRRATRTLWTRRKAKSARFRRISTRWRFRPYSMANTTNVPPW